MPLNLARGMERMSLLIIFKEETVVQPLGLGCGSEEALVFVKRFGGCNCARGFVYFEPGYQG